MVVMIPLLLAAAAAPPAAAPRQGWASKDGVIALQRNGVRLQRDDALDRARIGEAFSRWGIAYDEGQTDVIRSLFTPAATFRVLRGSRDPIASADGVDAIVLNVRSALAQQADQRRHAISNVVIDRMSATEAHAIAYGIVTSAKAELSLAATVIYSGDLQRGSDEIWRFSRFVIGMDSYAGAPIVNPN